MDRTGRAPCPEGNDHHISSSVEITPGSVPALDCRSNSVATMNLVVRPTTPPTERQTYGWNGLPSPNTPSLNEFNKNPPLLLDDNDKEGGGVSTGNLGLNITRQDHITSESPKKSESIVHGSDYSLMASPTPMRRSMRAKKPVVSYSLSSHPSPGTRNVVNTKQPIVSEAFTPCELTTSSAKAETISFEGLPAVRSLDWELQYPPGGSTHPSYPYPMLDSRLIFSQPFVPEVDGLPDVSKVPKLVLPLGWRQVSWCGLLPVVFDPYRQAFKLTPIGPFPLTCEELHQGGLQKYVPGGELHPETGLLPDMIDFNDGSTDDVYNWDDVDWIFPWSANDNVAKPPASSTTLASGDQDITVHEIIHVGPATIKVPADAWDCPDNIVDLEEAWRWIEENENRTGAFFEASLVKTWRGTGIHCVSRKFKQPIAGLMAIALAEHDKSDKSDNASRYLVNQNGREFCAFKSVSTPVNVDITLMKDVEITLFELLAYFPNHYRWRGYADRFVRSGMRAVHMANFVNMTRMLKGDAIKNKCTVHTHIHSEPETPGSRKRVRIHRPAEETTISYTADGWNYNVWELSDYPLLGLAHGLKCQPTGPDAGPLTACIEWCRKNGRYTHMLSHVPDLLKEIGTKSLIEPGENGCPDKEVLGRHSDALHLDRKRVLKESKRVADKPAPSEPSRKRIKIG